MECIHTKIELMRNTAVRTNESIKAYPLPTLISNLLSSTHSTSCLSFNKPWKKAMSKSDTLASCIAKMYDGAKADTSGAAPGAVRKPFIIPGSGIVNALGSVEVKLLRLEGHVERIASGHADVLQRLDMVCKGLGSLEKGLAQIQRTCGREAEFRAVDNQTRRSTSSEEGVPTACSEVRGPCWENMKLLKNLTQEGKSQRERLAGIEESVSAVDTMLEYIAEVFQSSKVVEFTLKGDVPWRIKGLLGSTVSNRHQVGPFWLSVHLHLKNVSLCCVS